MKNLSILVPCRKGSTRTENKNFKKFCSFEGGLLELKLEQLLSLPDMPEIMVSTNDSDVIDWLEHRYGSRLVVDRRPEHLCTNEVNPNDFVKYCAGKMTRSNFMLTHVTSPFLTPVDYEKAYAKYLNLEGYDSLATFKKHNNFFFYKNPHGLSPLIKTLTKWPRTQDLKPLYEITHGIYICSRDLAASTGDRMGEHPYVYEVSPVQAIDIDYPEDFQLAEDLWSLSGM